VQRADPFEKTPQFDPVSRSLNDPYTFGAGHMNHRVINGWSNEAENMRVHRRINSSVNQSETSIDAIVTTKNNRRSKNKQKGRLEGASASPIRTKNYSLMDINRHIERDQSSRSRRQENPHDMLQKSPFKRRSFEDPDMI